MTQKDNLKSFDNKCIRIVDSAGDVFEGICGYNSCEYDEHEYGRAEEGLQIESFLFYKSDIKDIDILDGHTGPYGRFSGPYSKLEELTVEDGIDSIRDALSSEEKDHVMRLLFCLNEAVCRDKYGRDTYLKQLPDVLNDLILDNDDEDIREAAERIHRSLIKDEKIKNIKLRPHHILCVQKYIGYGYNEEFTDHMDRISDSLNRGGEIVLHEGCDDICSKCPHNREGRCISLEKVERMDGEVLKVCGFLYGDRIDWNKAGPIAREKIFETGEFSRICGDCQWYEICRPGDDS